MIDFKEIDKVDNLQEVIKEVFEIELDVAGDWGYNEQRALVIQDSDIPLQQLQHTLATIRAQIEMSLALPEEKKYGSINVQESGRESITKDKITYEVVSFSITAMLKSVYAQFIQEYKDGYGKNDFDIEGHFQQREENTIRRDVKFWFITNFKEH
jgi:hypothetical protein